MDTSYNLQDSKEICGFLESVDADLYSVYMNKEIADLLPACRIDNSIANSFLNGIIGQYKGVDVFVNNDLPKGMLFVVPKGKPLKMIKEM